MAVGDVVSIDLSATVDGGHTERSAEGTLHGSAAGSSAGLDDAVLVCPPRVFTAKLAAASTPGRKLGLPSRSGQLERELQAAATNSRS